MRGPATVRYGVPVAVFAAVLAGLVALNAGGGTGPGTNRLEPLRLAGGAAGAAGAGRTAEDSAASTTTPMHYGGGEIVIPDELLAGQPAEGPVHDVDGDVGNDRVAALARALGLVGTVESDAEGWRVRTADRALRVFRQHGASWYFGPDKEAAVSALAQTEPAVAPEQKPSEQPGSTGGGAPGSTGQDTPVSDQPCDGGCPPEPRPLPCPKPVDGTEPACDPGEPQAPPPSDAEARASAQRVFDAAGISDATITVNDAGSVKEVVASPRVGGLPTVGFETRVAVAAGGIVEYASGFLGTTSLKADYPLLAPRDAVRRSYDGVPRAAVEPAPCPTDARCPTPQPREAKTLRLGLLFLQSYDAADGGYLAPAWLMTFGTETWQEPTLALPDEYVAKPPPASDQPAVEDPAAPDAPVSHP